MTFDIASLHNSSVWALYRMRNRIQLDPEYQRLGDIWTLDERQLLIDSILNGFDVPKIYLHKFHESPKKAGKAYDYAIIDGKQRLETMWSFLDGKIALADDFRYFKDPSVDAGGMKYDELGKAYPDLKNQFDTFLLTVISIDTDDLEMIEEMFSRLNEAAPLTAPEKRNAYGGPLPVAIKKLATDGFFCKSLPFPNKRYRHFDLATKFLLAEHEQKVVDTKKAYLDEFVKGFKNKTRTKMPAFLRPAETTVEYMAAVFTAKDPLLRQVGMVTIYYHLFRLALRDGWITQITRKKLLDFDKRRETNRKLAEQDLASADYDLIEFDRYAQSPNDAGALKFRPAELTTSAFAPPRLFALCPSKTVAPRVMLDRLFGRKVQTDDL
jgi:hypothetical protein